MPSPWGSKRELPDLGGLSDMGAAASSDGRIFVIGGNFASGVDTWGALRPKASVNVYDPISDTWTSKSDMPTPRLGLGVVALGSGEIYAVGGYGGTPPWPSIIGVVERYDPVGDAWTSRASVPTPRGDSGVAARSGRIYVVGGHVETPDRRTVAVNLVEEYDPTADTWTTRSHMPTARTMLRTVSASNGRIYAIGGRSHSGHRPQGQFEEQPDYVKATIITAVEEYDPVTDEWISKTDMPEKLPHFAVAATGGKIYVFGSHHTLEYDPSRDAWARRSPISVDYGREGWCAVGGVDGNLYLIGGTVDWVFNTNEYKGNETPEYSSVDLVNQYAPGADSAR